MLRFICFKCNLYRPPHSGYENILNFLNLKTLKDRKKQLYITFLLKLLNNKIDDSSLLSKINLKTSNPNTRNKELFYIKPYT